MVEVEIGLWRPSGNLLVQPPNCWAQYHWCSALGCLFTQSRGSYSFATKQVELIMLTHASEYPCNNRQVSRWELCVCMRGACVVLRCAVQIWSYMYMYTVCKVFMHWWKPCDLCLLHSWRCSSFDINSIGGCTGPASIESWFEHAAL